MKQMESFEEKHQRMTTMPVPRLVCSLAVPTIASMLITSVYNMADTYFVGKLGTSATAAVGVALPLMCIIQALGFTFGMGSGNYVSRLLGQKDIEKAERVATTGFLTTIGLGVILMLIGQCLVSSLITILGATDTIAPYAKSYIRLILIGMPWMAGSFVLNNLLRYQGDAFFGMIGIGAGGLLNILLDPLFIFIFNLGTSGAALATILSQFISFCMLLYFCTRGDNIRIHIKRFTPRWEIYKEILRGGLPSFYRQGLASIATIILNTCARPYGDAAIAAMSIVTRVMQFALSALLGFGQGFQPVCGFNYGAKQYKRVLEAFWFCVRVSIIVLVVIASLGFMNAPEIVALFRNDPEVIAIGTKALRIQCITFPLSAWIVMNNMLMQTIGKGTKASILALARQGLFFIPIILFASSQFGLIGVEVSQSLADVCAFLLATPLGLSVVKEIKRAAYKED
ncbi:MAG: MATE family efflux transporter [Cellulosilyticum sp.]|nr:MATE family efflux transporter [Cellulosilyticum sp.]